MVRTHLCTLTLHRARVLLSADGLDSVPEESTSGVSRRTAAAEGDLVSPLLLLDALKVNLHLEAPVSTATGGYSREDPADSDEESDAGGSCVMGAGPPYGVHIKLLTGTSQSPNPTISAGICTSRHPVVVVVVEQGGVSTCSWMDLLAQQLWGAAEKIQRVATKRAMQVCVFVGTACLFDNHHAHSAVLAEDHVQLCVTNVP